MFHGHGRKARKKSKRIETSICHWVGDEVAAEIYNTGSALVVVAPARSADILKRPNEVKIEAKKSTGAPSEWRKGDETARIRLKKPLHLHLKRDQNGVY